MGTGLVVTSLVQVVASGSFALVARLLSKRRQISDRSGALWAFVAWWASLSIFMLVRGIVGLQASLAAVSVPELVGVRYLEIILESIALWGLTYYVAYLFTGRQGLRPWIGAYFAAVAILYAVLSYLGHPSSVSVGAIGVVLLPDTPHIDIVYLLFGIPPILVTLAYLSLAFRSVGRSLRYRIAMVSAANLAWIGGGLVASIGGDALQGFYGVTVLGLLNAGMVFLAYWPPRPISVWLGDEPPRPPAPSGS